MKESSVHERAKHQLSETLKRELNKPSKGDAAHALRQIGGLSFAESRIVLDAIIKGKIPGITAKF